VTNLLLSHTEQHFGKPKCPADGVSGIAQTDILLLIFYVLRYPFRPYTQIAKNLDARPRLLISIVISADLYTAPEVDALDSPRHYHLGLRRYLFLSQWSMMSRATTQKMRRSARAQ